MSIFLRSSSSPVGDVSVLRLKAADKITQLRASDLSESDRYEVGTEIIGTEINGSEFICTRSDFTATGTTMSKTLNTAHALAGSAAFASSPVATLPISTGPVTGPTRLLRRPQLRLVEDVAPYVDEIKCPAKEVHSLHDLDVEQTRLHPLLARAMIERFSAPGQIVLDPAARFGTAALEANLLGREGRAAEIHAVLASICGAKITPADIAEVALMCQMASMRRPVALESFREHFSAHFDVETYRELVTLRGVLGDSQARIDNVVRALGLSLLHGPSAGYFSVAAPLSAALNVDEQHAFNVHRRQRPDYRAVLPRLLKRAASLSRDGVPPFANRQRRKTIGTLICDPRRLETIETGSIDMIITEPRLALQSCMPGDQSWLRNWFAGVAPAPVGLPVNSWSAWLNECLLEWARVLKPNARAVLVLGEFSGCDAPEVFALEMVRQNLARFFAVEGSIIERAKVDVVRGGRARSNAQDVCGSARVLVLKRR